MAKEYDSYKFKPSTLLPGALKRNNAFPLDITNLFLSVEDAENYAKGSARTPDERGLYLQSYAGQIIGVKTDKTEESEEGTGKSLPFFGLPWFRCKRYWKRNSGICPKS